MLSKAQVKSIVWKCYAILKRFAPEDTGTLKAMITIQLYEDGFGLRINAPYTVYTNEAWISPKWNGKQNPNEMWIQDAYNAIYMYLYQRLNGLDVLGEDFESPIEREEVAQLIRDYQHRTYGV